MTARLFPLALAIGALGGCAAGALPPSRSEVGTLLSDGQGDVQTGLRLATGAHWASAVAEGDVDYDVGAGFVHERREAPADDIRSRALSTGAGAGEGMDEGSQTQTANGGYLSFARVISRVEDQHQRTWLGVRAEFLHASAEQGGDSFGASARLDWEIFGPAEGAASSSSNCGEAIGVAYGSAGLGLYLESGIRSYAQRGTAFVASAGVSLRLPFLAGVGLDFCADD